MAMGRTANLNEILLFSFEEVSLPSGPFSPLSGGPKTFKPSPGLPHLVGT
jgi:hypothetical protein